MYVQYVDLKITVKNFTGTFADKLGMIVCQKSRDVVVYGCGLSYKTSKYSCQGIKASEMCPKCFEKWQWVSGRMVGNCLDAYLAINHRLCCFARSKFSVRIAHSTTAPKNSRKIA